MACLSLRFAPALRALGVCEHSSLGKIEKFIFFSSLNGLRSGSTPSANQIAENYTVAKYFPAK